MSLPQKNRVIPSALRFRFSGVRTCRLDRHRGQAIPILHPHRELLTDQAALTSTVTLVMLYNDTVPPIAFAGLNSAKLMPLLTELR